MSGMPTICPGILEQQGKTDTLIFARESGRAGHACVSTVRRQLSFKNVRQITSKTLDPGDISSDDVLDHLQAE
jgi:hypothetical protein